MYALLRARDHLAITKHNRSDPAIGAADYPGGLTALNRLRRK
jgi:hypothetical protein